MAAALEPEVDARTQRQLRLLEELAELGMTMARAICRQAVEAANVADGEDAGEAPRPVSGRAAPAQAFAQVSRAVRMTLALESRIVEGRAAAARVAAVHARFTPDPEDTRRLGRKFCVHNLVVEAIEAEVPANEVEGLLNELEDRYEQGEYEADFRHRSIGEMVARICGDLGIVPDFDRWADSDWAMAEAAARTPGSPYAIRACKGAGDWTEPPDFPPGSGIGRSSAQAGEGVGRPSG